VFIICVSGGVLACFFSFFLFCFLSLFVGWNYGGVVKYVGGYGYIGMNMQDVKYLTVLYLIPSPSFAHNRSLVIARVQL